VCVCVCVCQRDEESKSRQKQEHCVIDREQNPIIIHQQSLS
jgi:hypothetical protein